ncbi:MAG: DUF2231 domain-containing protein [Kofleriaceae bacterium]
MHALVTTLLSGLEAAEQSAATAEYWTKVLPMHPKMVHIPIALCIVMPMVITMVWFGIQRGWFTSRTWLLCAALQGVLFVSALGALQSGKDDGAKVEGYASEDALETHRDRASWFVYVAGLNLMLSASVALLPIARNRQQLLGAIAIVASLGGTYAGYLVGDAGGRLVYVANASDAHK